MVILAVTALVAATVAVIAWTQRGTEPAAVSSNPTFANLGDLADTVDRPEGAAPLFTVPTRDGEFSLARHLATDGRPVFLNLWASWCFPCRAEMPALNDAAIAHPEVLFVGVAIRDDFNAARAFADEIGIDYTIGFDVDETVNAGYPTLGMPATYLIGSDGAIVDTVFGALTEGQIEELITSVGQ